MLLGEAKILQEHRDELKDEKEAKKIRRILANRESARESICRRQAIRDELTKRVSDLSSEHDKLKMEKVLAMQESMSVEETENCSTNLHHVHWKQEKELAMQESMSVEETNKQLKEQIAKLGWPEVQGVASSSASQQMEDEKESKKIICDELTKRVSDMSSDNDMLKMEKELAMQGYMSLEQPDKKLKEQIAKTVRPEVQGVTSSAGSQQMENEKEARKIRRILVKSAREKRRGCQSIRDELTKRVSDLSSDNDKLKMEKELAMQEYMSFKETNKQLKELIAKTVGPEVQGVVSSFAFQQTEFANTIRPEDQGAALVGIHNMVEK